MGSRVFEPYQDYCEICGKYTLVYDIYGDIVCGECLSELGIIKD